MNFAEAVRYLYGLGHETLAMKLGLENIERLLDALGKPHERFLSVQIAGTNGKGSVAAMLDAICRAAGISTGLYTSPHLVSITERIRIEGNEIARTDFARCASRVRIEAEKIERETGVLPTFFEQVTATALLAFADAQIELAILETGLGGRLDATTAARARTVALTPIDLDHREHLGSTLAEIAAEKAAIIRPGTRAVIAPQHPEAMQVIERRCRECEVTPHIVYPNFEIRGSFDLGRLRLDFVTERDYYENVRLNLRGRHQAMNAAVAIALAEALRVDGFEISREAIIEGLGMVEHAGRLELLETRPRVLLDGAHNAAGARALREFLDEFVKSPITLIFGAMRDKDLTEIARILFPAARELVLTRVANERAASIEALIEAAPRDFDRRKIKSARSVAEALARARDLTPEGGLICVTGSLYLIGETKAALSPSTAI